MAKLICVAVFDQAAQSFQRPLFVRASGEAMRWFEDMISSGKESQNPEIAIMARHADQFQLYELGSFDDFSATFSLLESPKLLVHGSAFKDVVH